MRSMKGEEEEFNKMAVTVSDPLQICKDAYLGGEMGTATKEQYLILKTRSGLVIVTGCAHPGIVAMIQHAKEWLEDNVYLVLGGFHLMGYDESQLTEVIMKLKGLGVKKIAPSHCTGDDSIKRFREAWGGDFIEGGCGAAIRVPVVRLKSIDLSTCIRCL